MADKYIIHNNGGKVHYGSGVVQVNKTTRVVESTPKKSQTTTRTSAGGGKTVRVTNHGGQMAVGDGAKKFVNGRRVQ